MLPAQDLKRLSLKGMARPDNGYSFRESIEVVLGSVSCSPSTRWIGAIYGRLSSNEYATECYSACSASG